MCIGRVRGMQTTLFASLKVGAAPQTWYRGSWSIIATKPCLLMMVSATATTRHGSVPVGGVGLFFTGRESESFAGPLQSFNCVFCAKYPSRTPSSTERAGRSSRKKRAASSNLVLGPSTEPHKTIERASRSRLDRTARRVGANRSSIQDIIDKSRDST
jgi:hypothetical protein